MRRGMRVAVVAATCVGLAAVAAPTVAGPPNDYEYRGTEVVCFSETEGLVQLGAFFAPDGTLEFGYGEASGEDGAGVWVGHASGSLAEGAYQVSYAFLDEFGEPAGTLDLSGGTLPAGDPYDVDERWRDGNTQARVTGTVQDLLVTGQVTAATGQVADLVGVDLTCMGVELDLVEWGTNPATRIYRDSFASGVCSIGEDGFLSIDIWGDEAFGFLALGIDWEAETADLVAQGPLGYDPPDIAGDLAVESPTPEAEYVAVDLQVGDVLDRGVWHEKWGDGAHHERYVTLALSGTASIQPDGGPLALTDCVFTEYSVMDRYSSRAGQKPGGRPPVNDLPDDAVTVAPAAVHTTSTRGAAALPEAPCTLVFDDDEPGVWEVPFGRTVWYSFDGTGQDVTLDTAGSDFDTVLGVYESDLTQVTCVDDVATDTEYSLQARVTVATQEGRTYLVQAGGFAYGDVDSAEWGSLVLTRS